MSIFLRPVLGKIFKLRESQDNEGVKPFLEHLEDLRWMLVKMAATLAVAMIACFCFRVQLMDVVKAPLRVISKEITASIHDKGAENAAIKGEKFVNPISLHPTDSMSISLSLAFYAGFVVSFPILLYFLAGFVLPALTRRERMFVLPAIGVSFGLFLTGAYFCFHYVMPLTLRWLYYDSVHMGLDPEWTISDYISFATQFILIFGLSFELPVVVIALVQFGLLTASTLRSTRAYAVVLILAFAAFVAPSPDPMTMGIVAGADADPLRGVHLDRVRDGAARAAESEVRALRAVAGRLHRVAGCRLRVQVAIKRAPYPIALSS